MDAMLRALIIKPRVRGTEDCLLMRPNSPALFRQGAAPGPQLLLERQRGKINDKAALHDAWKKLEEKEETDNLEAAAPGRGRCHSRVEAAHMHRRSLLGTHCGPFRTQRMA